MKNIVVPIDFSAASRNAAKYAASLAKSFDAEITLINVTPPAIIIEDAVFPFTISTEAEILQKNQGLMKKEVKALTKEYEVKITGFAKQGYVPDMIREIAKEKHADLIVMGRKGKGKSNSFFGSTTTTIIRKLLFPVLIIPEKAGYRPIQNITFASDFDPEIEIDRYNVLMHFLGKFNSKIYILNVEKNDSSFTPEKAIGKMEANVAFAKRNYEFDTINEKNVEEGISKFLEKNPSDILAMVAHKHTFLTRMFGKVHTTEMSYQTKIPLLVLPDK
jgi:nucleotide-binding universal stress UspA family protein